MSFETRALRDVLAKGDTLMSRLIPPSPVPFIKKYRPPTPR